MKLSRLKKEITAHFQSKFCDYRLVPIGEPVGFSVYFYYY